MSLKIEALVICNRLQAIMTQIRTQSVHFRTLLRSFLT